MNRLALFLFGTLALLIAGCGEYVAPAPTRSPVEAQQTRVALAGVTPQPTFVAPTPDAQATGTALQQRAAALDVPADDPRARGRPDAPVLIVEYSDYE